METGLDSSSENCKKYINLFIRIIIIMNFFSKVYIYIIRVDCIAVWIVCYRKR